MSSNEITECVGDEYDEALKLKLVDVLQRLGGVSKRSLSGIAGSQELDSLEVTINGKKLIVESETFIGLTITGEKELVNRIKSMIASTADK